MAFLAAPAYPPGPESWPLTLALVLILSLLAATALLLRSRGRA